MPLAAVALAACLILAGAYYLVIGSAPRFGSWADARRGRARNATTGIVLMLLGLGAFGAIVLVSRHI